MIEYRITQDDKPIIKDKNGEEYVDLIQRDFKREKKEKIINFYVVKEEDICRPDIIAIKMYVSQDDTELFLKSNEISNPFSIEPGEIFYHFDKITIEESANNFSELEIKKDIRNQYIKPEKASKIDPKLKEFVNREDVSKLENKNLNLPPNFAKFGDLEVKIESGKIVFGDDVTRNNKDCGKPLSKSELLAKIIKNRI